ncbi:hypothetical protein HMPREF9138_01410 [Prevotella histicola F0411]|uniref:Uncharacterized protein n=1 Tax=Prevotella histicola F0411 TaxID=857291 RepID=G6AH33_9BACT|nr:hypothetical protein HMPREF9138_01410 [Prevotella histicola F0411]
MEHLLSGEDVYRLNSDEYLEMISQVYQFII